MIFFGFKSSSSFLMQIADQQFVKEIQVLPCRLENVR
jgi:hypothetical protein